MSLVDVLGSNEMNGYVWYFFYMNKYELFIYS